MDKKTFFVIEEEETATGKVFSHAEKVPNCYNLLGFFKPCHGCKIISVNACDTWKEAQAIAQHWNNCARNNNKYMFA